MREWVFGYASLVADYPADSGSVVCVLAGRRRVLGVAADNARTEPSYKIYLSRRDGSRPAVYVAFVDIVDDPSTSIAGIAIPVDAAALAALDLRERNYDRTDVTGSVTGVEGRVWTYLGSEAGRERLRRGRASGLAVVSKDYLEKVHDGYRALGGVHYERFLASSELNDLPLRDLDRKDLPGADSRVA